MKLRLAAAFFTLCWSVSATPAHAGLVSCTTTGLEALWHMDEGSGSTIADCSGNVYNGTISGATWTTGVDNDGLSFDGSDDHVDLGDLRPVTASFSIEAWVKPAATVSGSAGIIMKRFYRAEDGSADASYRLILYDNQPCFGFANGANIIFCADNAIPNNQWTYLVGTYDASSGVGKLYVNCELVKTVTGIGTGDIQYDTHRALIGALSGPSDVGQYTHFNGKIDEVGIYEVVLSAADVVAHYEAGPGCNCP